MKAFLLAAGFGERLRPLTDTMPKPLVPVLNVPAICYALSLVKHAGITDVVCNLHYRREQIMEFFRRNGNFGLNITFSIEETILGTGGGLENCREHLMEAPFVYLNSDIIAPLDLKTFVATYNAARSAGSLLVCRSAGHGGRVTVKDGRVINLRTLLPVDEKPDHDFLGIAVLSPDIFRHLKRGFSDIVENGFIDLAKEGSLGFHEYNGPWHDIGSIESYRLASMALLDMEDDWKGKVLAATNMEPRAIAATARIGKDCTITKSVIGEGCVVGDGAVIEESVLLSGTIVESGARIVRKVIF
ncbi:MAG TPA: NDP-sugar synthase [Spirochaetota bacterium]|nr:NDP-sugar synthase [Spirochaetota bacterium]HPC41360.1 NDP-sugar synthase [Spirochaetota bacterium]HPL15455.1 NDP-sugar synthase [Spirochaetota bacterium]HQF10051.1 NDP-sugar synthase [Spirochaetota bacterium]HQH98646.1 NDP-sugar synthase [Spirochaetota bacterium]